jgi:hypothetical protein
MKISCTVKKKTLNYSVIFQVLTAASMKCRVFWDIAPCSHVEVGEVSEVRTASSGYSLS